MFAEHTDRYLRAVDTALPGFVTKLYIVGSAVADLGITVDPAALRRYNLENLRDYWRPLARRARQETGELGGAEPVPGEAVSWLVLGPARLHHTLAHGTVVAKADAGAYLGRFFPAWTALQDRAVRWRGDGGETFTVDDLRAAADAVEAVVDDAWTRWGDPDRAARVPAR